MIRKLLFALGLAALLGTAPTPATLPVAAAASLAYCTGSGGTTPCPDPLIQGTYNGLVSAINSGITSATMAPLGNFRNLLDNPKFDIYAVSSGTAYTSTTMTATLTGISTTCTYLATRWCLYANGSGSPSGQLAWSGNPLTGFQSALTIQRTSGNTATTPIVLVQEVPAERVIEAQGQQLYLSFWAQAGANFSAASNNLQIWVSTGTSIDQGISALIGLAGSQNNWTGLANQLNGTTQAITTTWTRYCIPAGVVPTNAQSLALQIGFTPVGTAGANDNALLTGVQLEISPTGCSPFEYRSGAVDFLMTARNGSQSVTDGATTRRYSVGLAATTSAAEFVLPIPVPMRAVPTVVGSTNAIFAASAANAVGTACGALTNIATSNTVSTIGLRCGLGSAPLTAGNASEMLGANTGNALLIFNDF